MRVKISRVMIKIMKMRFILSKVIEGKGKNPSIKSLKINKKYMLFRDTNA